MPEQDIAEQWKAFSPERRTSLLGKMTPEQKKKLRTRLEAKPAVKEAAPESTLTKVGRGAAMGVMEGLGAKPAPTTAGVIRGSIQQFGQGISSLVERAGEPFKNIAPGTPIPIIGTALNLFPTFLKSTAESLDTTSHEAARARQQGDWETFAEKEAQGLTNIAMLRGGGKAVPEEGLSTVGKLRKATAEAAPATAPPVNIDTLAMREAMAKNGGQLTPGVAEEANKIKVRMQNEAKAHPGFEGESDVEHARRTGGPQGEVPPKTEIVSKASGLSEVGQLRKSMKDRLRPLARKVTGVETAVKEAVEKTAEKHGEDLAANKTKRAEIARDNLTRQREAQTKIDQEKMSVAEENKGIEAENKAGQESVTRRERLTKMVDAGSLGLREQLGKVEESVGREANAKFNEVRAKIGNPEMPADPLIATVKNIEKDTLQDIPEQVKEFRRILSLAGDEEGGALSIGQDRSISPGEPGYEAVKQAYLEEGLLKQGKPVTWDLLQSLKSRLDLRLRNSRGMNGDLKRGLYQTRDRVVDTMGEMADEHGAGDLWKDAKQFYRNWKEDFHEPTGPSGSGSPIAQALDAVDPKEIRSPFLRKQSSVGNRALDILRKYPQHGGLAASDAAEQLLDAHETMKGLPEKFTEKPLKTIKPKSALNERKPQAEVPETPTVDVEKISHKQMEKFARNWGSVSQWDARRIFSSSVGELIGATMGHPLVGTGLGYTVGTFAPKYIGRLVEKGAVQDWLMKMPKEEVDIINKIPGADKIKIVNGIAEVAAESAKRGKPVRLSTEARTFLGPANVAKILAVNSSVQGQVKNRREALTALGRP